MKKLIALAFLLVIAITAGAQAPKTYKYQEYLKSSPRTIYFRDSVFAIESMRPFDKSGYLMSTLNNEMIIFQLVKLLPDSHLFQLMALRFNDKGNGVVEPKENSQVMSLALTYVPGSSILYTEFTNDAKLFLDIIKFSKTKAALDSIGKFKEFCLEDDNYSILFFSADIELFDMQKKMYNLMVFSKHKYENAFKLKYPYKVDVQESDLFYSKNIKHDTLFFSPPKGVLGNIAKVDSIIRNAEGTPLYSMEMMGMRIYSNLNYIVNTLEFKKSDKSDDIPYSFSIIKTDKEAFQVNYEYFTEDMDIILKDIPVIKDQLNKLCAGFGITVPTEITNFLNTYKTQEYFVKLYTIGDYAARFKLINFHDNKRVLLTIASKGSIKQ
jgi:hypothetical protein